MGRSLFCCSFVCLTKKTGIFYKGKVVAEEEKTGFTNKGQLVALLIKRLPKDIPTGSIVQFVIDNMDKGGKWMYEHQKGKGFR